MFKQLQKILLKKQRSSSQAEAPLILFCLQLT